MPEIISVNKYLFNKVFCIDMVLSCVYKLTKVVKTNQIWQFQY